MEGEKVGHSLSLGNQPEGHRIQRTEGTTVSPSSETIENLPAK